MAVSIEAMLSLPKLLPAMYLHSIFIRPGKRMVCSAKQLFNLLSGDSQPYPQQDFWCPCQRHVALHVPEWLKDTLCHSSETGRGFLYNPAGSGKNARLHFCWITGRAKNIIIWWKSTAISFQNIISPWYQMERKNKFQPYRLRWYKQSGWSCIHIWKSSL